MNTTRILVLLSSKILELYFCNNNIFQLKDVTVLVVVLVREKIDKKEN